MSIKAWSTTTSPTHSSHGPRSLGPWSGPRLAAASKTTPSARPLLSRSSLTLPECKGKIVDGSQKVMGAPVSLVVHIFTFIMGTIQCLKIVQIFVILLWSELVANHPKYCPNYCQAYSNYNWDRSTHVESGPSSLGFFYFAQMQREDDRR